MNSLFRKIAALVLGPVLSASVIFAADIPRERILINNDWKFSLGHAGDRNKDFTHGTEYFTYQTKVLSNNGNNGPVSPGFDDECARQRELLSRLGERGALQGCDLWVYGFDTVRNSLCDLLTRAAGIADGMHVTLVCDTDGAPDGRMFVAI